MNVSSTSAGAGPGLAARTAVLVDGLVVRFGPLEALGGISFAVEPGEVFGLLGRNGAGKTTTLRVLTTILAPSEGRALVAGHDVTSASLAVRASTVVVTTHMMEEADRHCERLVILDHGRLVEQGAPQELREKHEAPSLDEVFAAVTREEGRPEGRFADVRSARRVARRLG